MFAFKKKITETVPVEEPKAGFQRVQIVKIKDVLPHPNADRLEIALIEGWTCVVGKNQFSIDSLVLYIPVDSVLPNDVENILFPPGSKIVLHKSRIRSIKIRGAVSQGLLIEPTTLGIHDSKEGDDLAEQLDIRKYEPPEPKFQGSSVGAQVKRKDKNPFFKEYTDLQNFKWYPNLFQEDEMVYISEKVHGSNFRAGWVPFVPRTKWQHIVDFFEKKIISKFVTLSPKYEFVYGSRRVQLQTKKYKGFYSDNIYLEMVNKYDLMNKIPKGHVFYGEVYGEGVQKNYLYDCEKGERKLVLFDIQLVYNTGETYYICPEIFIETCDALELPRVPNVYSGPYKNKKEFVLDLVNMHPSNLCSKQKIKEGIVIKSMNEQQSIAGRKVLKMISDEYYLDKSNSDFH